MSKALVESFFPSISNHARTHFPTLFESLFPDDVATLCPEVKWESSLVVIRNPLLCAYALLGLLVGVVGSMRLVGQQVDSLWLFSLAFAWFAVMNLTALPIHCLYYDEFSPATTPIEFPILWLLDCLTTGLSSSCIIMGWCYRVLSPSSILRSKGAIDIISVQILLAALASAIFLQSYNNDPITIHVELWYLLPAVWAGVATVIGIVLESIQSKYPMLWSDSSRKPNVLQIVRTVGSALLSHPVVWLLLVSVFLVIGGVAGDATMCRWTQQHTTSSPQQQAAWYGDAFMAATLTFGGCDIAFVGLYIWLTTRDTTPVTTTSQR